MDVLRVLITEDDVTSAKLMNINLKRMGFDVVGMATDGEDSVRLVRQYHPDVILMDINMPGELDGIEAANIIKEEFGLPVIYVTANDEDSVMQRALISNPYGYILKPYAKEHLATIIEMSVNRYRVEQQLKENQRMISLTMKCIADGLIAADNDGAINFFNPVAESLLGLEHDGVMGRKLFEVYRIKEDINSSFIKTDLVEFLQFYEENPSRELYLYSDAGYYVPVNQSVSLVYDDYGDSRGIIITFRDITAIKSAREELKNLNDELESRVEKRTAELRTKNDQLEQEMTKRILIEKELKKSLEKEKEINELKSRIVTTISHEFRTPMTTIMSSAQLMDRFISKGGDVERLKKHTATIQKNVQALIELMNDVLMVERLDSKKHDIDLKPVNIEEFFNDIVEDARIGIGRNHQFEYKTNTLPKELLIDQKLLKQIVGNLLSNAFKYSEQGKTVFLIVFADDEKLKITVKDQGIGIPEENQQNLFDSFFRAKNVTNIEGTGVGLTILSKSLDLLGGTISFESKEGEGTTFFVNIPLGK